MHPITRNCYAYARELLNQFPIVAIIGARQVGKTTLSLQLAPHFLYVDLEKSSDYDRFIRDPEFFFKQHPTHIIFDEAQMCPELFRVLRSTVDADRKSKGRFILTGSSSPDLLENISETLAGRIAIIELGTLKCNEIYQLPLSSLYHHFTSSLTMKEFVVTSAPCSQEQLNKAWFYGGYPEPLLDKKLNPPEWFTQYELTYIQRDISKLFPSLDKLSYRRLITMLGKLSGTIINKSDLARALNISEPTVRRYLDIAHGTFLWRQLPSFEHSKTKSIVKMPAGHMRDSGLLHHILRIGSFHALQTDPAVGLSFEGFVIEEIIKGLQDIGVRQFDAYYYRTRAGSEIDLVLEGSFGLLPVEIKYGSTVLGRQLRGLTEFIQDQKAPFGLLINQGHQIEWLTPTILQVPAHFL